MHSTGIARTREFDFNISGSSTDFFETTKPSVVFFVDNGSTSNADVVSGSIEIFSVGDPKVRSFPSGTVLTARPQSGTLNGTVYVQELE